MAVRPYCTPDRNSYKSPYVRPRDVPPTVRQCGNRRNWKPTRTWNMPSNGGHYEYSLLDDGTVGYFRTRSRDGAPQSRSTKRICPPTQCAAGADQRQTGRGHGAIVGREPETCVP